MRISAALAVLAAFFIIAPAAADIIHLKDGRVIEGKTTDLGGSIRVEQKFGSIVIPKEDILRVEKKATAREMFTAKLAKLNTGDADACYELYLWAKSNDIDPADYEPLLDKAFDIKLNSLPENDTKKNMELYAWAKSNGIDKKELAALLERVLKLDPDHAEARKARGEKFFRGEWKKSSEVDSILAAEHAESMRARGYVYFHGQWLKPDSKDLLTKLEEIAADQKKLEALQKQVGKERKDFENEKKWAKRDREEAERMKEDMNRERKRIDERESRLRKDRKRLDDDRREIDDRERKIESDRRSLRDDARNALRYAGDIASEAGRVALLAKQLSYMVPKDERADYAYKKTEALTIAKRIKNLRDQLERLMKDF
jgi:DNA repair exonuclease SbcCD ATPase subunit